MDYPTAKQFGRILGDMLGGQKFDVAAKLHAFFDGKLSILTPVLVNEVQQLHEQITAQALRLAEISELKQQLADLKTLVATLRSQGQDERVAIR